MSLRFLQLIEPINNAIRTTLKELLPLTEILQEHHNNRKKLLEDRKFLSSGGQLETCVFLSL